MSNGEPGPASNKRRKLEGPASSFLSSTPIDHDDEPRRRSATPTPDVRQVQDPKLLHHLDGYTIVRRGHTPFTAGGFCDIFIGDHEVYGKVAMRRPRMTEKGYTIDEMKTFFNESKLWKKLSHPNILQFLGLIQSDGYIWAVSRFAENGPLPTYLEHHPETDRRALVLHLADAVRYLHRKGVVHGDIKGSNILVSAAAEVLLCDFGLSKLSDTRTRTSLEGAASIRWCAPEVLMGEPKTFASDVYSFAMTVHEILSGKVPFHTLTNDVVIVMEIDKDVRPSRGPGALESEDMDELWNIIIGSWDGDPSTRPTMEAVCERLGVPTTLALRATSIIESMELHSLSSTSALADNDPGGGFAGSQVRRVIHHDGPSTMTQRFNTGRRRMIMNPPTSTLYHTVSTTESSHPKNQVSAEEMLIRGMPRAHARYDDTSTKPSQPCHPGTRAPLLEDIRAWIEDDSTTNPIFWLCGELGVGKTTVAHTIAKEQDALGQLGASFFFNRDNDERRHPALFATTIAYQLTRFDTQAHRHVAAALQPDVDVVHRRLEEQFLKLVIEPLVSVGESSLRKIVIVIDGLDECSHPVAILDVLPLLTKYAVSHLRVLIASRPHAAIVTKFQSSRLCHLTSETHFRDIDSQTLYNDVRAYLKWSLGEIASEYSLPSPWPSLGEFNKLVGLADGLMVVASIFDRYIRDPNEGNPSGQLQRILSRRKVVGGSPTAELDSLYDMVLDDAKRSLPKKDVGFARSLLQLHFLAKGSWPVGYQGRVLDCTLADVQSALRPLTSVIRIPSDENGYITPFHASFGEYIQDPERCSVTEFLIEPESSHDELAIAFLSILIRATEDGITGLECAGLPPGEFIISAFTLSHNLSLASDPAPVQLQRTKEAFCMDAIWTWILFLMAARRCDDKMVCETIKEAGFSTACGIDGEYSLRLLTLERILRIYQDEIGHLSIRKSRPINGTDGSEDGRGCIIHEAELELFKYELCWDPDGWFELIHDPRCMVGILHKWSKLDHCNILPLRGIDFQSLQAWDPELIILVPLTSHYATLQRDWYPSLAHAFQQNAEEAVETVLGISRAVSYLETLVPRFESRHVCIEDIVLSKEGKVMINPLPFVYRQVSDWRVLRDWEDIESLRDAGTKLFSDCGFTGWRGPGGDDTPETMVWSFGCIVYEMMSGEPPLKRYHDIVMGGEFDDDDEPMYGESPLKAYRDLINRVETWVFRIDNYLRPSKDEYWWSWKIEVPEGCTLAENYRYLAKEHLLQRRYQTAIDHLLSDLRVSEDLKDILRSCWEVDPDDRPTMEEIADNFAAILEALRNQNAEAT